MPNLPETGLPISPEERQGGREVMRNDNIKWIRFHVSFPEPSEKLLIIDLYDLWGGHRDDETEIEFYDGVMRSPTPSQDQVNVK